MTDALVRDGYDVKRSRRSYAFAALHGIRLDGRRCSGGADPQRADPQRDGMPVSVAGQADGHRPNGR